MTRGNGRKIAGGKGGNGGKAKGRGKGGNDPLKAIDLRGKGGEDPLQANDPRAGQQIPPAKAAGRSEPSGTHDYFDGMRSALNATSYEQDASEAALRAEVLESIPAHMQHRLLSALIQSERSVPIKLEHELDASGGIALVRKVMVPQVLRSVGSAFRATAMLTFQPAWELGMRGYDSAAVTCTIQYVDETGQARLKETRKWLTQSGIKATVSMDLRGYHDAQGGYQFRCDGGMAATSSSTCRRLSSASNTRRGFFLCPCSRRHDVGHCAHSCTRDLFSTSCMQTTPRARTTSWSFFPDSRPWRQRFRRSRTLRMRLVALCGKQVPTTHG